MDGAFDGVKHKMENPMYYSNYNGIERELKWQDIDDFEDPEDPEDNVQMRDINEFSGE